MAIYVSNIVIEQGFDFDTSFQLEDTRTNNFLDLTGCATTAQIRKHSSSTNETAGFAATVTQEDRGIISITLTAAKTVLIKPGRYVYDVKIMTPTGGEYKAVEGSALVRGGVTR